MHRHKATEAKQQATILYDTVLFELLQPDLISSVHAGQSKLANIMFTYEMAKRLQPSSNITVNCLHPGVVRTELPR